MDIFSVFDDHNKVFGEAWFLIWICAFMVFFCTGHTLLDEYDYFKTSILGLSFSLVYQSLLRHVGGSVSMVSSVLYLVLILNFMGLFPYVFSITSHIGFNICVAFPIWFSIVLMSVFYNVGAYLSHLQPLGSPVLLNPFLCLIELVSLLVRPLTLAVRITANLSAGHILLVLLSSASSGFILAGLGSFYLVYEMAVCFVQGYIFVLLPTLYGSEHPA